jgi:hypothetical protein
VCVCLFCVWMYRKRSLYRYYLRNV